MILLDASIPRRYLSLVAEWGYPAELSSAHVQRDAPDPEIIALAGKLEAALLTVDLDFANILDYPRPNTAASSFSATSQRMKPKSMPHSK